MTSYVYKWVDNSVYIPESHGDYLSFFISYFQAQVNDHSRGIENHVSRNYCESCEKKTSTRSFGVDDDNQHCPIHQENQQEGHNEQ